jgi:hypothetical protein
MKIKLTEKEIDQQLKYVAKYQNLLSKEINFKDLADMENINRWMEGIKVHMNLIITNNQK